MSAENLTAVLKCKGVFTLEKRKIGEPQPHEVLIAVHSVGICGSDIHHWKHGCIGDLKVKFPKVPGHEPSGTVVKIGANVKNIKPGDRVCIKPGITCQKCEFCRKGRYNICPEWKLNGSLCQYICHDAEYCFKLPDNVSLEEGALIQPLSVAVHACRRASISAGMSVLICGAGPCGLLNLLTCKAMGALNVCVTGIGESRLEVARKLGASSCLSVKDLDMATAVKEIKSRLGGSPDVTIECSGAESSIRLGIMVTKTGGTVMLVGFGAAQVKIPILEVSLREVDVKGMNRYTNCYPTAIGLVSSGAVDVKPLITHTFKLEETIRAFETSASRANGTIKVLIKCSEEKLASKSST